MTQPPVRLGDLRRDGIPDVLPDVTALFHARPGLLDFGPRAFSEQGQVHVHHDAESVLPRVGCRIAPELRNGDVGSLHREIRPVGEAGQPDAQFVAPDPGIGRLQFRPGRQGLLYHEGLGLRVPGRVYGRHALERRIGRTAQQGVEARRERAALAFQRNAPLQDLRHFHVGLEHVGLGTAPGGVLLLRGPGEGLQHHQVIVQDAQGPVDPVEVVIGALHVIGDIAGDRPDAGRLDRRFLPGHVAAQAQLARVGKLLTEGQHVPLRSDARFRRGKPARVRKHRVGVRNDLGPPLLHRAAAMSRRLQGGVAVQGLGDQRLETGGLRPGGVGRGGKDE